MKNYFEFDHGRINNYSLRYHVFTFFKRIELVLFIVLSLVFLMLSKVNRDYTNRISYFFVDISLPVVNLVALPFNLLIDLTLNLEELTIARRQNAILKAQNEEMRAALIEALRIKNENQELKELLQFIMPKSTNYKMAKVIGKTHQPFGNRLLLESRQESVLKNGSAVVTSIGMVGRVINAAKNKARLMLLTDSNSHIPIIVSESRNRGILYGNNSNLMEIRYLSKGHEVKVADLVFTSGAGGDLPPGLLVGVVSKVEGRKVYVKTAQDLVNADIVTVLQY